MGTDKAFSSATVRRVRRNRAMLGLAMAPGVVALGILLASLVVPLAALAVVPHLILATFAFLFLGWRRNPWPREDAGELVASRAGVLVNGEPLCTKEDLRAGYVVPRAGKLPFVRLVRKGLRPSHELVVASNEEGRALLTSLGLDASQTTATFRLPSKAISNLRWRMVVLGVFMAMGAAAAALGARGPGAGLPVILASVAALAFILAPSRLDIGADGVVMSWLGTARFIPWGDVRSVESYVETEAGRKQWHGVQLELGSGELVRVPVSQGRAIATDKTEVVLERAREAMETFRAGNVAGEAMLLRRGTQALGAWLRRLRDLGSETGSYRTEAAAPERLWRIVEDPRAEPDARAGAAVVLAPRLDAAGRDRLRVAAAATALPQMRVALETVASDAAEEELAEALGKLDAAKS